MSQGRFVTSAAAARMGAARALWPVAAVAAIAAVALSGPQGASLVARAAGIALALSSLVVLTGWSGQLNLHVAAIGLGWGAYAAAGLALNGVPPLLAIVLAPVLVAPAALAIGAVAVRFRGLELAIATLAAGLAFEQMVFQNLGKFLARSTTGSAFESSLIELARPAGFTGDRAYALLAIAIAAVWLVVTAMAGRGKPGRTLRAIRDREVVAEARGVAVFGWRLGAFVLSIAVASVGGALLAGQTGAVTADSFGLPFSLQLLAVATVVGITKLERALLGAVIIIAAQEAASVPVLEWFAGDRADLVFGVGLIAALAVRSRRKAARVAVSRAEAGDTAVELPGRTSTAAFTPTVLRVENVSVAFGAIRVLRGVDLRVGEGEIVGLVGGNGAGKTTLFNCITGLVIPDAGAVFVRGADVTQMPPHRRAHLGLARTFQGVEVFEGLTVEDGLLVAAGLRSDVHGAALRARIQAALQEIGIADVAQLAPESLPFATLRLVEIASALVADPALVLLDEPLAGLDAGERARVLHAIVRLRGQGRAVVIVEHDRASVDAIADRVYEMREGRAIERGTAVPEEPASRPRARRSTRKKEAVVAARA